MALQLLAEGRSVSGVARTFNVHPATIYRCRDATGAYNSTPFRLLARSGSNAMACSARKSPSPRRRRGAAPPFGFSVGRAQRGKPAAWNAETIRATFVSGKKASEAM
ncbi:hypothetical protein [uncultured Jannaschia sp.]|uniref:hypothetical protein n=1 Tax=uncultured Jannaschia sp. TaxID=293347 RepID=UPI003444CD01